MSDIEKRKELSDDENFGKNSFNEEKGDEKNQKSAEKESSQSADQRSVTKNISESEENPAAIPADNDKEQPESGSLKDPDPTKEDSEEGKAGKLTPSAGDPEKNPVDPEKNSQNNSQQPAGKDEEAGREEEVEDELENTESGEKDIPDSDLKKETGKIKSEEKESAEEKDMPVSGEEPEVKDEPPELDKTITEGKTESADAEQKREGSGQELVDEKEDSMPEDKEEEQSDPEKTPAVEKSGTEEEGDEGEDKDDEDDEDEEKDYGTFSKEEIIHEMEELLKTDDVKKIEKNVRELKSLYDDIFEKEKKESLQRFLEEGGAEVEFEYAGDALDSRYSAVFERYKTRRNNYYANLDKEKDTNLQKKHEVLEKLRSLVDGEETTTSIGALKEIQKAWKEIGPVPNQYAKSLWATYNILIDRFYDNRSIYFELKELDRKKNLEGKLELCARAEELAASDNIKEAVKELNELHEEFKHIGPVPKEVQEDVWQRFKAASDAIYARRKEFVGRLKKDLNENLKLKMDLVEEVGKFRNFDSDKISEWNDKTKEILDLQKKWETIGGLPREHARDINKSFWSNFKSFFNNKNRFFKKLEGQRDENLSKKEELVKKAEALMESDDWGETAEKLKELQKEWKNVGPVPEKYRNDIYKRFKSACDTFFDRRRSHSRDVEGDYRENLKNKEKICGEIEKMIDQGSLNPEKFRELQLEYDRIGYVPRNAIRKIQKKYDAAVNRFWKLLTCQGRKRAS
jgi:hypothetical protein